ncbi:MAG TPA: hypothetical protein PLB53_06500, partial [Candidatus Atribacteria bacterium]|nr:hypothetical protein [Candidatus Atribacteria bacterium]
FCFFFGFSILWTPDRTIQEFTSLSRHSRNLLSGIQIFSSSLVFQYHGPRLEDCRGDEEVGIHVFCP